MAVHLSGTATCVGTPCVAVGVCVGVVCVDVGVGACGCAACCTWGVFGAG